MPVAGADYVGPLPAELQGYVNFAVGVLAVSKERDVAQELVKFMSSPEAAPLIRKSGMEPAPRGRHRSLSRPSRDVFRLTTMPTLRKIERRAMKTSRHGEGRESGITQRDVIGTAAAIGAATAFVPRPTMAALPC